jgi:hypothetical protein
VTAATEVQDRAEELADSPWAERAARLGLTARGTVYLVVGLLAGQVARRGEASSGREVTKDGALSEIAGRPFGTALLIALAVGLTGYAVWRLTEAAGGRRDEPDEAKRSAKRVASAAKALLYGAFAVSTVAFVVNGSEGGTRGDADRQEQTLTAEVLALPGGQLIVAAVGLAIVAGGGYLIYRGFSQKFDERLDTSEMGPLMGSVVDVVGTVGLAARGVVFGLAGMLLVKASLEFDSDQAKGLDGTLKVIARQTYGQVLLTTTAIGLIAYGLYSYAEARYRRF